jgi:long-chain fatty acid transport protein
VPSDMPAMLAVGAMARVTDRVNVSIGLHSYFDKSAEYGKMLNNEFIGNDKVMDNNFWEFASGVEFWASDKLMLSLGYLFTQTGVSKDYQTDLSHSLSTFSLGGGLLYMVTDNIGINLGAMRTFYSPDTKNFGSYGETYARKASVLAIGLDFSF